MDGKHSLGFYSDNGEASFSSGTSFIAGAYYAADELNVSISINDDAYKIIDQESSRLLFRRYYLSAYNSGTEIFYTDRHIEEIEFEGIKELENKYLILSDNHMASTSEVVLGYITLNYSKTMNQILNNYFNREFIGGIMMPLACELDIDNSNFTNFTKEDQISILTKLELGLVTIPYDYDSLMEFLATLDSADGVTFNKDLIEGIQPY